ncbi:unnamed protein product [Brassica oleracea var. botrytis]
MNKATSTPSPSYISSRCDQSSDRARVYNPESQSHDNT